ncbi:MAG TPA: transglycosylase domain-containing protein, partial [Fibrobacteria bacterium]|nr:transglycosylase domain-containing protein [Fibrobacteria bacterium]
MIAVLAIALWATRPGTLFHDPSSAAIFARDGRLLGAKIAADGQWRFPEGPVGSKRFALAVQAYEDRRFRRHPGVDPFAVFRALRDNL